MTAGAGSMGLFGDIGVRVDPWASDYGSQLPFDPAEEPTADVVLDVELTPDEWRPLLPRMVDPPRCTLFVDGVRRVDARVLLHQQDVLSPGAFATFAAGAVRVQDGSASFEDLSVGRVAIAAHGLQLSEVSPSPELHFLPVTTPACDPDAPRRALLQQMRLEEERLARAWASREDVLAVKDGPLTFADPQRGMAVGLIKSIHQLYVPGRFLPLLASMPAGARTPLFAFRSSQRFERFSWYLRLAPPFGPADGLCGLVRLEIAAVAGRDAARWVADATAHHLPRFASTRVSDPRAPQNLLPVGALEQQLRRRMGDAALVRRRLEALIALEG